MINWRFYFDVLYKDSYSDNHGLGSLKGLWFLVSIFIYLNVEFDIHIFFCHEHFCYILLLHLIFWYIYLHLKNTFNVNVILKRNIHIFMIEIFLYLFINASWMVLKSILFYLMKTLDLILFLIETFSSFQAKNCKVHSSVVFHFEKYLFLL